MERRELIKRAWIAPLVLTYAVTPSMARAGSDVPDSRASWAIDYVPRGDISQVSHFYGPGAYLFLKGADAIQVYFQQAGWQYQGVYGQVPLPDGFPLITFTGSDDQAVVYRP